MKPTVIFMVGFPGSGKSTVAKATAEHFHAAYLDKDCLCNTLTGAMLSSHGEPASARDNSQLYKDHILQAEYETLFHVANSTLFATKCVVIDAPFVAFFEQSQYLNQQRALYQWHGINLIVVEVYASVETTKERLISRGEARDQWKLDHWEEFSSLLTSKKCCWEDVYKIRFDNSMRHAPTSALLNEIAQQM